MHKVKTQRSEKLFVKNMLIFKFFYMVIIKNYKVKRNYLTNFRKFPEIFRGKFPEISELTTLVVVIGVCLSVCLSVRTFKKLKNTDQKLTQLGTNTCYGDL